MASLAQSLDTVLLGQGQWVRTAGLQRDPEFLPTDHPDHAVLLDMHVRHLAALRQRQLPSGMFGQVLNVSGSYQEFTVTCESATPWRVLCVAAGSMPRIGTP